MKERKRPERSCIVCRGRFDKRDLLRIVRSKDDGVFYDPTGKANGRGAYVCTNPKCLNAFLKKNFLERSFRTKVPEEQVQEVRREIEEAIAQRGQNPTGEGIPKP